MQRHGRGSAKISCPVYGRPLPAMTTLTGDLVFRNETHIYAV